MDEYGNDPNAGAAGDGSLATPDLGTPGGDPSTPPSNSGSPEGQNGQPPAQGADELTKYKAEVRRLNQALAKASSQPKGNQPQPGQDPNQNGYGFDTPEGQYAAALQIADAQVRKGLEDRIDLYPEVDSKDLAQVRKNPWAFASHEAYITANVEQALSDIEYHLLDLAEAKAGNPASPTNPTPASVNGNPAPVPPPVNVAPGTEEDTNPWTMPLDKLEKVAQKEVAKQTVKS